VSINIFPHGGKPENPFGSLINWPLAQVGWLTSAYLFAFYSFGYRYILQSCLNPVRNIILHSKPEKRDKQLDFQETKDITVRLCSEPTHFCSDPIIGLVVPFDDQTPFHQEVSFLSYHVRLPVPSMDRREIILQIFGDEGSPIPENSTSPADQLPYSLFLNSVFIASSDYC
jgi:hypothetical protein